MDQVRSWSAPRSSLRTQHATRNNTWLSTGLLTARVSCRGDSNSAAEARPGHGALGARGDHAAQSPRTAPPPPRQLSSAKRDLRMRGPAVQEGEFVAPPPLRAAYPAAAPRPGNTRPRAPLLATSQRVTVPQHPACPRTHRPRARDQAGTCRRARPLQWRGGPPPRVGELDRRLVDRRERGPEQRGGPGRRAFARCPSPARPPSRAVAHRRARPARQPCARHLESDKTNTRSARADMLHAALRGTLAAAAVSRSSAPG